MNDELPANSLTTLNSPWWAKLLDRFGIPTAMLAVIMYFAWASITWTAERVAVPLAESHLKFLNSVDKSTQQQTEVLEKIAKISEASQQIQVKVMETVLANQKIMQDTNHKLTDDLNAEEPD